MKTELRTKRVVELWHDGKFIATITGADGPGVLRLDIADKLAAYFGLALRPINVKKPLNRRKP